MSILVFGLFICSSVLRVQLLRPKRPREPRRLRQSYLQPFQLRDTCPCVAREFYRRSSAEDFLAEFSLMNERECLLPTIRVGCDGAYFNFQIGGPSWRAVCDAFQETPFKRRTRLG